MLSLGIYTYITIINEKETMSLKENKRIYGSVQRREGRNDMIII